MSNLFRTPLEINLRYDLKGSYVQRTSRKNINKWFLLF